MRPEPHHHAVEDDVLARGELEVEADAELDERRQPPGHADPAAIGLVDARHDLQQRALAGAVAADDPEELALVDVERHVAEDALLAVLDPAERVGGALLERVDPVGRDPERLVEPAHLDDDRARRHRSVVGRRGVGFNGHQQQQYHARAMAFPDLTALKDFAGWKAATGAARRRTAL